MTQNISTFRAFAKASKILIPGGGIGTSLQLKGVILKPGSWSGEANLTDPDVVEEVHSDFHDAGSHIANANTYSTAARRIITCCPDDVTNIFHHAAIAMSRHASTNAFNAARAAAQGTTAYPRPVFVAGSIGPIGNSHDVYTAGLSKEELLAEQTQHAKLLAELGADILFVETMGNQQELDAATLAAAATEVDTVVSLTLNENERLFDNTTIKGAIKIITNNVKPAAIMINCTPLERIGDGLEQILEHFDGDTGAYPNGRGNPNEDGVRWDHDESPESIQEWVEAHLEWHELDPRVKIHGGCCGASKRYVAAVSGHCVFTHKASRTNGILIRNLQTRTQLNRVPLNLCVFSFLSWRPDPP